MAALEFNFADSDDARPGWRLHRLEMLNWGTFGGARVHIVEPLGGWSLLVGENGSGKSTAIDALRTLLVPRQLLRGSFNDAAGGQGRRDRTLASYIRGQWSASREDEADSSAPAFLRSEDTLSVLLAVFCNERRGARITLAQLLSASNGKDHTTFLVAPEEKSIAGDLQGLGSGRELSRQLKERGFAVYDSYPGYFRDFGQRLGVPDPGAMEIFNQAIGIKEVASVNDFLRRHLLGRGEAIERISERIVPGFANLEQCWDSIQRDKEQIALLAPVVEAHERVEEARAKRAEVDRLMAAAPRHYAARHAEMLDAERARLDRERQEESAAVAALEERIGAESAHRDDIKDALSRDETTLRIDRIKVEIDRVELTIRDRRQKYADCERVAAQFSLGAFHDETSFSTLKSKAVGCRDELAALRENAERDSHDAGVSAREIEPRIAQQERELRHLRERRVLIPDDFQNVRDYLCGETGMSREALPFAGELIEVKPERDEWTGAIERLLHTFGVSLLVPEPVYRDIAPLVSRRRLLDATGRRGLRFFFHRVPIQVRETSPLPEETDTVAHYLNHRREHPISRWVEAEIARAFPHVCCRDTAEFERHTHGITREGLIRGGTRHVKDDRQLIDDRTQYVLGWSPQRKIEALEQSIASLTKNLELHRTAEKAARDLARRTEQQILLLEGLIGVAIYAEIDFGQAATELDRLRSELAALEAQSETRARLQEQLKRVEASLDELNRQRDERRGTLTLVGHRFRDIEQKQAALRGRVAAFSLEIGPLSQADLADLAEFESGTEISLATIEEVERRTLRSLEGRASNHQRVINQGRESMGSPMRKFLEKYPEEGRDLDATPDYAADFVRIHRRLVDEDLPAHEERFREFLNQNLIQHVGGLDAALAEEVKGHHRRLEQVNAALARLEYSHGTHVEIHHPGTRDHAIREFHGQLRDILGTGIHLESEPKRLLLFEKMRSLVSRFRADPEWTRKVADSRHWIDFGIRERRREDGAQVDYFDSSQGKSGGQKAKLAFTVLAASLHAQYGLAEDEGRADTFRLVIIDEIFARTDEPNSRRALTLFQNLGFQLLLAAPWEAKVRIAEPYVDSYHLALNPAHSASSVLKATREAYEQAREHRLATPPPAAHGQP
jgi:uncharacterized protein YPO0396